MAAKKRVLILGVTGMLGHMVRRVLADSAGIDVCGTHILEKQDPFYYDVMSGIEGLKAICNRSSYDYFINCIGILPAKINRNYPANLREAVEINSFFPRELSILAKERGARVIHISTDGVFSGESESYYEDDVHDCRDLYGITKSMGEVIDDHFLNLRCSIIGPSPFLGEGLLEWFLRQENGSQISGYSNQIWHGISTYQFADLCLRIIDGNFFTMLRKESAVYHFAPNEPISKYDLLCLFKEIFKKDINIKATASDDKTYKRILQTKYRGLKKIYPFGIPASRMVSELALFTDKEKKQEDIYANSVR